MRNLRTNYLAISLLCTTPLLLAKVSLAQDDKISPDTEAADIELLAPEPAPTNTDANLPAGNLQQPTDADLDPDFNKNGEELKPSQDPEQDPHNAPSTDAVPDNFLVGASVALTVPHVRNLALESVFYHNYGVSLNYGTVTETISNIAISVKHTDIRFRWFPWKSSFFAGLALGQHTIKGELDREVAKITGATKKVAIHGTLVASANYVAPQIGWFAIWDGGFTLGADIGYLLPSSPKSTFTSKIADPPAGTEAEVKASKEYTDMKSDLEAAGNTLISKPIPLITIIRLGWMF